METFEVVIKIPKDIYKRLDDPFDTMWEHYLVPCAYAIRNGTVLPKGHGRLIDGDELRNKWIFGRQEKEEIDNAPTIIEADKEVKNDDRRN